MGQVKSIFAKITTKFFVCVIQEYHTTSIWYIFLFGIVDGVSHGCLAYEIVKMILQEIIDITL